MSVSKHGTTGAWSDPDEAPEWTDAMFDAASFSHGAAQQRGPLGPLAEHRKLMPRGIKEVYAMAGGSKTTSDKAAKAASKTLKDGRTGKASKTAAGSALSQKEGGKKK